VDEPNADEGIRRLTERGEWKEATSEVIRRLGPEILGLLVSLHRDTDEAGDAFSIFTEKLWRSLEHFEWRCSMRTWAYVLARRASQDVRRMESRRARRVKPLSLVPELEHLVAAVRTQTMTILRTETKSELTKLRETLPEDDQLLLVLRVDRKLEWKDLAAVFLEKNEDGDDGSPEHVKREAARLRKRFQLVKERLHALAKERGLIRG
jgi:RNA polymerase sigma-70 factor (ECF subfamily)